MLSVTCTHSSKKSCIVNHFWEKFTYGLYTVGYVFLGCDECFVNMCKADLHCGMEYFMYNTEVFLDVYILLSDGRFIST